VDDAMQCNAIAGVNKFVTGYMQNIGIIYANQQVQKYYTDKRDYTPDMRLLQNYFSNLPMKKLKKIIPNDKSSKVSIINHSMDRFITKLHIITHATRKLKNGSIVFSFVRQFFSSVLSSLAPTHKEIMSVCM
jgi:hypothetical protein